MIHKIRYTTKHLAGLQPQEEKKNNCIVENATRTTVNANASYAAHNYSKDIKSKTHKILHAHTKHCSLCFFLLLLFDLRQNLSATAYFFIACQNTIFSPFCVTILNTFRTMSFSVDRFTSRFFFFFGWHQCNQYVMTCDAIEMATTLQTCACDTNNPPRTFFVITLNFINIFCGRCCCSSLHWNWFIPTAFIDLWHGVSWNK